MPPNPQVVSAWYSTGRFRIRRGWFNKAILQKEQYRKHGRATGGDAVWDENCEYKWADVDPMDYGHDPFRMERMDEI